jgi:hypothetical protein
MQLDGGTDFAHSMVPLPAWASNSNVARPNGVGKRSAQQLLQPQGPIPSRRELHQWMMWLPACDRTPPRNCVGERPPARKQTTNPRWLDKLRFLSGHGVFYYFTRLNQHPVQLSTISKIVVYNEIKRAPKRDLLLLISPHFVSFAWRYLGCTRCVRSRTDACAAKAWS